MRKQKRKKRVRPAKAPNRRPPPDLPELKSTMETGTSHGGAPLAQFDRFPYGGSGHGNPDD